MENRDKIMAAAQGLFAARGYEAVGVQEAAAAAGVTKPTLYHYFGSKRGLLEAILEDGFSAMFAGIGPAAAYGGDLPLTLFRLAGAYFAFAQANRDFYRLFMGLWFAPPDSEGQAAIRPWTLKQHELIKELFRLAARDHGNMKGRERRYAATYVGMVNTMIGLHLQGMVELDDELTFNAVHQFMHGIFS